MPTVSPDPSTACAARAAATFMSVSASEIVGAHTARGVTVATRAGTVAVGSERGASTSPTYVTSGSLASVSRSAVATSAVTVEYSGLVLITCTPRVVSRATAAGDVSDMRICTIGRPP